ncbi:MAG TPA: archaeosortase/exosortase family protein [Ferruginibacter sp.]|nr:archaeosortase/exosortase family protein [Ferruginibacter sp.]
MKTNISIKNTVIKHPFIIYLVKFFAIFCIAYYGTIAVEGLAMPGNHYSSFIDNYLDYPSALRQSLLQGAAFFLKLMGHNTFIPDPYRLQLINGSWVKLVYACLGVGVMCFWLAFVMANKGKLVKKITWVLVGLVSIWLINVLRITLVLLANNNHAKMPLGLDNHTFFNILAYAAVFILMFLYDKRFKKKKIETIEKVLL